MTEPNARIAQTSEIIKHWQEFGKIYSERYEYNTQPMLYSLITNLKIHEAGSLLELSCGGGKSLPIILSLKKPDCLFFATEISENMLNLSSRRMEYIEKNLIGSLQFFDGNAFEENQKQDCTKNFPNSNTTFCLMDNETLDFKDEMFDICFSSLSLMIVENYEKMISESFRVTKKGGKVGFTVWASKEKSLMFTLPTRIIEKHGYFGVYDRSSFHLNDRKMLINLFEKAGFKNILCWSQYFAYNFHTEEDFNFHLETIGIKKFFNCIPNEDERKKIRKEVLDEYLNIVSKGETVGLDIYFITSEKP